jgi:predicted CopG family antitoxin
MPSKQLKLISVSQENYLLLKGLGGAGDSFNDVITVVLKRLEVEGQRTKEHIVDES